MNAHAGWSGLNPTMIGAALVILLGVPAAMALAVIGFATWLGVIVWW